MMNHFETQKIVEEAMSFLASLKKQRYLYGDDATYVDNTYEEARKFVLTTVGTKDALSDHDFSELYHGLKDLDTLMGSYTATHLLFYYVSAYSGKKFSSDGLVQAAKLVTEYCHKGNALDTNAAVKEVIRLTHGEEYLNADQLDELILHLMMMNDWIAQQVAQAFTHALHNIQ